MKKTVYSLFVAGEPKAQPRPRKGRHGNFYNPPSADAWREAVQVHFLPERKEAIKGPVMLTATFFFHREGIDRECIPHTTTPDADNLIKAVMDALTQIGVYKNDAQVYSHKVEKYWTPLQSGMKIVIEEEI